MPAVSYSEKKTPKKESLERKNVIIQIPEGENPEIYTQEHEKLLGDSEAVWELCVDGYDDDGLRIYDPHQGRSCHQCRLLDSTHSFLITSHSFPILIYLLCYFHRQKTLGLRTNCYKCEAVRGQFCGDCLYTRFLQILCFAYLLRSFCFSSYKPLV